jgi:hypothetical protein
MAYIYVIIIDAGIMRRMNLTGFVIFSTCENFVRFIIDGILSIVSIHERSKVQLVKFLEVDLIHLLLIHTILIQGDKLIFGWLFWAIFFIIFVPTMIRMIPMIMLTVGVIGWFVDREKYMICPVNVEIKKDGVKESRNWFEFLSFVVVVIIDFVRWGIVRNRIE